MFREMQPEGERGKFVREAERQELLPTPRYVPILDRTAREHCKV
jgi:hypothetical protein